MTTCHSNWSSQHRFTTTHYLLHRDTGPSIRHASNLSTNVEATSPAGAAERALTSEITASPSQGSGCPEIVIPPQSSFPLQTSPPSPPAACLTGLAADGPDVHRPQWPAQSSPDSRRTKPKGQVPTKMTPFPPRKCLCGVRGTGAESKILSQTKGQLGSRPTAYAVVPYPFLPQPLSIAAPLPAVWSISRLSALWRLQTQGGERTGSSNGTPAHLDS